MLANGWQIIPERGVVRSREPFKFWWALTISLERLIVSGVVNADGRCGNLVTVIDHQFITLTVDICVQHGGREALRRTGLSAAAETRHTGSTKHENVPYSIYN